MKNSQYAFALLLTLSIGSVLRFYLENPKSSLVEDTRKLDSSLESLQTKTLNQIDLIKNQQEQLQSLLTKLNNSTEVQRLEQEKENKKIGLSLEYLEAKSLNQQDSIKNQQDQLQSLQDEFIAMQAEQQKQQVGDKDQSVVSLQNSNNMADNKLQKMLRDGNLKYILGVSTGHAGSTTVHKVLREEGCPWKHEGAFELHAPKFRRQTQNDSDICAYTRDVFIPYLDKRRNGTTWIDAGHFHNRGPILECLASLVGPKVAFLRIRRNRHDIAKSFDKECLTPCFTDDTSPAQRNEPHKRFTRPGVSYCPLESTTPISLSVNRDTWNKFTTFQKFLWTADELEMRFHKLQTTYPESQYLEMTWSTGRELSNALRDLRTQLGCQSDFEKAPNTQRHVKHGIGNTNCTDFISQDIAYRTLTQYSDEQKRVLFYQNPQPLHIDECKETEEELRGIVASLSAEEAGLQRWVYKTRHEADQLKSQISQSGTLK